MNTTSRAAAILRADDERLRAEQDWPAIDGHRGCSESLDMPVLRRECRSVSSPTLRGGRAEEKR